MSLPVVSSIPLRTDEELTSITTEPWLERRRSISATFKPIILAAQTAVKRSSGVI